MKKSGTLYFYELNARDTVLINIQIVSLTNKIIHL